MRIGPITASAPIGVSSGPYGCADDASSRERLHRGLCAEEDLEPFRMAGAIEQANQRLFVLERAQQIADALGLRLVDEVGLTRDHDLLRTVRPDTNTAWPRRSAAAIASS